MAQTPKYRGLRRTSNREALLGAAAELIGSDGLAEVSIDDIVHRAGVAKGTFYNHFVDKQEIAHYVALGVREQVRDEIAKYRSITSDPAFRLSIALTLFLDLAVRSPHRAQILITMLTGASDIGVPMNERVRATLEAGKASGRLSFVSLETALVFVLGVVMAGVGAILEQSDKEKAPDLIGGLVIHALIGLGVSRIDAETLSASAQKQVL